MKKIARTLRNASMLTLLALGASALFTPTGIVQAETKIRVFSGKSSFEVDCKTALSELILPQANTMAQLTGSVLSSRGSLSLTSMDRTAAYKWKPTESGAPAVALRRSSDKFYSSEVGGVRGHGVDVYETLTVNIYADGRAFVGGETPRFNAAALSSMRCFRPAERELELSGYLDSRKAQVTLRLKVPYPND